MINDLTITNALPLVQSDYEQVCRESEFTDLDGIIDAIRKETGLNSEIIFCCLVDRRFELLEEHESFK